MRSIYRFLIKAIHKASPVILVSLCFFVLNGCDPASKHRVYALEGRTMGTTYHITAVVGEPVAITETQLQMEVDKLLEDVNQVMSTYISDSELSLLNKAPVNQPTVVSEALFEVLALSEEISQLSDGAFDVTVGPLVNLWGFGPGVKTDKAPEASALAEAMARIGYEYLILDDERRQVTKERELYIDLSAIAKGYGADELAELFQQHGITNYMIELGGELAVAGNNPEGVLWRIGVEQPTLMHSGSLQGISVPHGGIATSGDYRNYYEVDGVRYSHTIDPETGKPVTHKLASVTVVSESAAKADGLATALNVLGPEKGYALSIENGIAAYFVIRQGEGFVTKASPEFNQYRLK